MESFRRWARGLFLLPAVAFTVTVWAGETADAGASTEPVETRPPGWVDEARVIAAGEAEPGSWLAHGQTYEELRFSTLTQINRDTVGLLGLAWVKNLDNPHRMHSTPLVIDGVMYFTDPWSVVYAVDAKTGEEHWRYDPQTNRSTIRYACCGSPLNRGVAAYKGRLYFATFDARLIALDQATGERVWEVDTTVHPTHNPYTVTGAPRVVHGKVFIGQSSSEFGLRGHLSAYDADTGELAWRFFTVPGDPSKPFEHPELEEAAKTWSGEWWKLGGGGTVWHSIVYDAEFDQLLFGTGNGAPWPRAIRSPGGGDNLFLGGVMSVDPNTGRMNWFYQMTPGDNWDFNACQDIALLDMEIDGKVRPVLLQGPKNGFFYVLDRTDGELLRAFPYVRLNWATHIDMATGRPVENPDMAYDKKPQWVMPSNAGGHSWQAMAVDPGRGYAYLPVQDMAAWYGLPESFVETGEYELNPNGISLGVDMRPAEGAPPRPEARGFLKALDPVTGKEVWSVERATAYNGSALATAGDLVFQGDEAGQLAAFDADTGALVWEYDTQGGTPASPITYALDGEQYLAVQVSRSFRRQGSDGRMMVFKLGAEGEITRELTASEMPEPPPLTASEAEVARGETLYNRTCVGCHGIGAVATINADLRMMTSETHAQFQDIVRGGVLSDKGMLSFAAAVTEAETELIRQYVISQARKARVAEAVDQGQPDQAQ